MTRFLVYVRACAHAYTKNRNLPINYQETIIVMIAGCNKVKKDKCRSNHRQGQSGKSIIILIKPTGAD
jgi:hypothetical protein